jgi:NADP-dependent 3-hydroxy acid dehydrogenase YdfG
VHDALDPVVTGGGEDALGGATALVTGGTLGIGRAVAERLHAGGARVLIAARDEARVARVARELGVAGIAADVSKPALVVRLAAAAEERWGGAPDIVVHAAGAFALTPLARTPIATFDRQIAVNLRAAFLLIRTFLPGMLERGTGHLVTIGSIAGRVAFPENGAYSASKFGVRGLHAVLDAETRGTGVRATLVEPAATDTALWDAVDPDTRPDLPDRAGMLRAADVADAVFYAVTRPPGVDVRSILVERS